MATESDLVEWLELCEVGFYVGRRTSGLLLVWGLCGGIGVLVVGSFWSMGACAREAHRVCRPYSVWGKENLPKGFGLRKSNLKNYVRGLVYGGLATAFWDWLGLRWCLAAN